MFILFFVLFIQLDMLAQKKASNQVNAIYFNFTGCHQIPSGDLSKRYGNASNIGFQMEWVDGKTNLLGGLYASFTFGNNVKEDIGKLFRNHQGVIFGTNQTAAALILKQRAYNYGLHVGKLFAINAKKNPKSGIRLTLGLGHFRHWIKINDESDSVNQFNGEYKKGYDRLTAGFAITPFFGYQHTSLNRYLNFIVGIDYMAAFTKNQRSWDYDLFSKENERRFDGLLGFRMGFSLPLFVGDSKQDVEY